MAAMNHSKRGRPFKYSGILMAGIAYTCNKPLRVMQEMIAAMLGEDNSPDHVTI